MDVGAGSAKQVTYTYRLNDLYDFEVITGGHQPMGLDECFTNYRFGYVIGTKVTVKPLITSVGNTNPVVLGYVVSPSVTPPAYDHYTTFVEDQHRRGIQVGVLNNQSKAKLTCKWSAKRFFGKNIVGNTEYANDPSEGPGIHAYLHVIGFWPDNYGLDPAPANLNISAESACVFKEKIPETTED